MWREIIELGGGHLIPGRAVVIPSPEGLHGAGTAWQGAVLHLDALRKPQLLVAARDGAEPALVIDALQPGFILVRPRDPAGVVLVGEVLADYEVFGGRQALVRQRGLLGALSHRRHVDGQLFNKQT